MDMAPSTVDTVPSVADQTHEKEVSNSTSKESGTNATVSKGHAQEFHSHPSKAPLKLSGVLDQFNSFDVTPVIWKGVPRRQSCRLLGAPNSDELLKIWQL